VTTAGGAVSYLRWHRGPTHGPIGLVGLGVLTAAIVTLGYRIHDRRERRPDAPAVASFAMLAVVSTIGVLMHVLMDVPTVYGTRLLSPFDWHWFAVDWMPIVDVTLIIVLASGLLFARPSVDARRRNAMIVLMLMAANYGVRGYAHHQALMLAPRLFGPTLPRPCDAAPARSSVIESWPRERSAVGPLPAGKRCLVEIAAMPTFMSPFIWRIIAQMSNAYEIHDIDLLDARFREPASDTDVFWRQVLRYPNLWNPAVERAAATRVGRVFLGFSRFPAARSVVDAQGVTTVRWNDMRFVGGSIVSDQPVRRPFDPFAVTVRIGPEGQILQETLGR
jgi:membrane-bound metal-dependent hydrolase YbcI (DUF457 family)